MILHFSFFIVSCLLSMMNFVLGKAVTVADGMLTIGEEAVILLG